ncbi:FecCD family ABC transporter permease [Micropruina sp.]|uniref:FecCD family ABC transporter permease n=1 Tax=Micropruina sp. TaxID=2737536 RepID=UPI0039E5C745
MTTSPTVLAPNGPASPAMPGLPARRTVGLAVLGVALVGAIAVSLAVGANLLPPAEVWRGLVHPSEADASIIVWTQRIPRTVVGIVVGAALGVSGALIQALTRNPLADPGILGVDAGAGFAITVGIGLFGVTSIDRFIWLSFAGAAAATVLVYVIGSAGRGVSAITLVLAGVALSAVLGGASTFLALIDQETFRAVNSWGAGSITRAGLDDIATVLPFLLAGLALALLLSTALNSLALGDDLATALGANVVRTRLLGLVSVTLLAGVAAALAPGIVFVGLMVPHVVRWFVGPDQRWIVACSAVAAPVLVLVSDVVGRIIARPGEMEVGIVTAVVGGPVLIALVRRRKASGL